MEQETRNCQNCKQDFTIEPDDFGFYKKINVPAPTFCPQCRVQRRLTWRNDLSFYTTKCGLTGKNTVTIYAPDKNLTVYSPKAWWSDNWDPLEYGRDYDFSRPFFEQFADLQRAVPRLALVNDDGIASVSCEYTSDWAFSKNCYMSNIGWRGENVYYTVYLVKGRDIVDCLGVVEESEYCYDSVYIERCYNSKYIYYSRALTDCVFCFDCRDCQNCFLSTNLRGKQYVYKNKQLTKEEYEKVIASYRLDTHSGVERARKEFEEMLEGAIRRPLTMRQSVNCLGNYLLNCRNVQQGFNIQLGENLRYVWNSDGAKDSYDMSVGGESELVYEGITPDHSYNQKFSIFSWKNRNTTYVDACHGCEDCFGCVGLKKKQYCILNKQYTKEEYGSLMPKIRKHMEDMPYRDKKGRVYKYGEFFPSELSYIGYNDSAAYDEFPLNREAVLADGLSWQDDQQITAGKGTLDANAIPDEIDDVSDTITQEILTCTISGRNYRITPWELTFYRRHKIPIPRVSFQERHRRRFAFRNPLRLVNRTCDCAGETSKNQKHHNFVQHAHGSEMCPNVFQTTHPSDNLATVYCDQCYNAEVA